MTWLSKPKQKFHAPYAPVAFALALHFKVPLPGPEGLSGAVFPRVWSPLRARRGIG